MPIPSAIRRFMQLCVFAGNHNSAVIVVSLIVLCVGTGLTAAKPMHIARAGDNAPIGQPRQGLPRADMQTMRTIEIDMEYLTFNVTSVVVRAGETIRFVLRNTSPLPHDFTIGNSVAQEGRRAVMNEITEAGRLNGKVESSDLFDGPNAALVFPGETKELVWRFTETKRLEFGCNVPGHYELGMKGRFAVRTDKPLPASIAAADRHPEQVIISPPAKLAESTPEPQPPIQAVSFKSYGDDL